MSEDFSLKHQLSNIIFAMPLAVAGYTPITAGKMRLEWIEITNDLPTINFLHMYPQGSPFGIPTYSVAIPANGSIFRNYGSYAPLNMTRITFVASSTAFVTTLYGVNTGLAIMFQYRYIQP